MTGGWDADSSPKLLSANQIIVISVTSDCPWPKSGLWRGAADSLPILKQRGELNEKVYDKRICSRLLYWKLGADPPFCTFPRHFAIKLRYPLDIYKHVIDFYLLAVTSFHV